MTRIMVDVSHEILPHVDALFNAHSCAIVGSSNLEHGGAVRLIIEGEFIPEQFSGLLCSAAFSEKRDGLNYSRTLRFERAA